jgi:hypothetical protein
MTFRLREADLGDDDLGAIAAIVDIGGRSVGTAGVGRIHNLPMRAVNARLGYRPAPDSLIMRGPLFAGMMTR